MFLITQSTDPNKQSSAQLGAEWDVKSGSSLNLSPANQPPVLFNSPTECNLLPFAGANWG
ncbi:hypothetical protein TorRG33x02_004550 [Trema orientale]|uniref:Uncharacterized protein n=1 Tax=Trema orientale TaxID=63057 RepID=A0A2P5G2A7_TREOI|nr:hypothetical protein TorRG33x02_004550 [Trema orientale]